MKKTISRKRFDKLKSDAVDCINESVHNYRSKNYIGTMILTSTPTKSDYVKRWIFDRNLLSRYKFNMNVILNMVYETRDIIYLNKCVPRKKQYQPDELSLQIANKNRKNIVKLVNEWCDADDQRYNSNMKQTDADKHEMPIYSFESYPADLKQPNGKKPIIGFSIESDEQFAKDCEEFDFPIDKTLKEKIEDDDILLGKSKKKYEYHGDTPKSYLRYIATSGHKNSSACQVTFDSMKSEAIANKERQIEEMQLVLEKENVRKIAESFNVFVSSSDYINAIYDKIRFFEKQIGEIRSYNNNNTKDLDLLYKCLIDKSGLIRLENGAIIFNDVINPIVGVILKKETGEEKAMKMRNTKDSHQDELTSFEKLKTCVRDMKVREFLALSGLMNYEKQHKTPDEDGTYTDFHKIMKSFSNNIHIIERTIKTIDLYEFCPVVIDKLKSQITDTQIKKILDLETELYNKLNSEKDGFNIMDKTDNEMCTINIKNDAIKNAKRYILILVKMLTLELSRDFIKTRRTNYIGDFLTSYNKMIKDVEADIETIETATSDNFCEMCDIISRYDSMNFSFTLDEKELAVDEAIKKLLVKNISDNIKAHSVKNNPELSINPDSISKERLGQIFKLISTARKFNSMEYSDENYKEVIRYLNNNVDSDEKYSENEICENPREVFIDFKSKLNDYFINKIYLIITVND